MERRALLSGTLFILLLTLNTLLIDYSSCPVSRVATSHLHMRFLFLPILIYALLF